MIELQKNLEKKSYWYASKKESQKLLGKTALFIELTAEKAIKDINKKIVAMPDKP